MMEIDRLESYCVSPSDQRRRYGGQVVSWKNERREDTSSKAVSKPPNAYPFASHRFARNRLWSLDEDPSPLPPANNQSTVDLVLKSTEEDLHTWPHRFELWLRVSVGAGKLTMIPRVRNVDCKAFSFTITLAEVRVEGLETLDYFDNKRERYTEQADAVTFDGEIDRVYLNTPTKIAVIDHERKRTIVLRKEGMVDAEKFEEIEFDDVIRTTKRTERREDRFPLLIIPRQRKENGRKIEREKRKNIWDEEEDEGKKKY
ncbi:hypothetical protein L1987_05435 [Smallanthus sonchifolius]|uniref:Uncharacterized protein n=1 Tax=Smallanthus sonchifolius TaxID=185202 RepID=A0ACB9JVC3_9ASTR|nr:hypothetical protein L1987_05435 [Smallanthus sonchifolius]